MRSFICFIGLVLSSSVDCGNVVKHISPKDIPIGALPSRNLPQARIVNGQHAMTNQFPYQVSIRSISGSASSLCGGSVISNQFILTAAHCTKGYSRFEIGFGSKLLAAPLIKMNAFAKTEHPDFNSVLLSNDIALIKLPTPIRLNANITQIRLPRKAQASAAYINRKAVLSGYGRTSDTSTQVSQELNYLFLRVIGNSECSKIFGSKVVSSNVICARGYENTNQNACLGDSGGPLAVEENGALTQIGIVSFVSSRGCSFGDPSGYTKVGKYLDWISQVTGINLRN